MGCPHRMSVDGIPAWDTPIGCFLIGYPHGAIHFIIYGRWCLQMWNRFPMLCFSISFVDHFMVCLWKELSVLQTYLLRSVTYPISLLIVYSRRHLWPSLLRLTRRSFMVYVWQELSVHTDVSLIFHHIPDRACLCIPSFMAFFSPSHAPIIFMMYV